MIYKAHTVRGDVRIVHRAPTWRGCSYTLSYVLLDKEPTVDELMSAQGWAQQQRLLNCRVISPLALRWSSLFHPRFFKAVTSDGMTRADAAYPISRLTWTSNKWELDGLDLAKFWLESVMFLAAVTLSAAIVQSRHSAGTFGSKYDRLWEAGILADSGIAPELRALGLHDAVTSLAGDNRIDNIQKLLIIRRLFISVLTKLGPYEGTLTMMRRASLPGAIADRFGFIHSLRRECGSNLRALIAYGSSIASTSFADYDVIVVTDQPEILLRQLAGRSPVWDGKELNLGIYSPDELIIMQGLSGDNLADYGLCLWGETPVVHKSPGRLLARNFSFGVVRQRQQLGMLSRALEPIVKSDDDMRNLYDYFVKIPANVAKGTFGAMGDRLSKETVLAWMREELEFDAVREQERAKSNAACALAASALATGSVMEALNNRINLVCPLVGPTEQVEVR